MIRMIGLTMALLAIHLTSAAQGTVPPKQGHLAFPTVRAAMDLSKEFPALEGRSMLGAFTTFLPGGYSDGHLHDGRPEILYVLLGTATVVEKEGDQYIARDYRQGEHLVAGKGVFHWFENRTKEPMIVLFVQIRETSAMPPIAPRAQAPISTLPPVGSSKS